MDREAGMTPVNFYFSMGIIMLAHGLWYVSTSEITVIARRWGRIINELTLRGRVARLHGWMLALFGLFVSVSGLQVLLHVQPNLIDAVNQFAAPFNLPGGPGLLFVLVYLALMLMPIVLTSVFGE
jgi:hypothetical protein